MGYTRFTNLEVTGDLKAEGLSLTDSTITKTAKADATAAASTAPTKAEYDAVVELVNDLKAKYNALVDAIT